MMPQNLEDAGVSWKVYNNKTLGALNDTTLSRNGYVGSFKAAAAPVDLSPLKAVLQDLIACRQLLDRALKEG